MHHILGRWSMSEYAGCGTRLDHRYTNMRWNNSWRSGRQDLSIVLPWEACEQTRNPIAWKRASRPRSIWDSNRSTSCSSRNVISQIELGPDRHCTPTRHRTTLPHAWGNHCLLDRCMAFRSPRDSGDCVR